MKPILKPIALLGILLLVCTTVNAQKKRLKRPSSTVGIYSVDTFVRESFDIYAKVYHYDQKSQSEQPLSDHDIDILENALTDVSRLTESAPNVLGDLDGQGALKQAKATLQINRAKKALRYSLETGTRLLKGRQENNDEDDDGSG